jgi:hypothetical protein
MNSPTPEECANIFLFNLSRTTIQQQQIWKERFLGKSISWKGNLSYCSESEEAGLVCLSVDIQTARGTICLFLNWPISRRDTALSFNLGDRVKATGVIKDKLEDHVRNRLSIGLEGGQLTKAE